MKKHFSVLIILLFPLYVFTQNVGVGTDSPAAKLTITGLYGAPLIPGNTSNGILRIDGTIFGDALDIGKMENGTFDAWLQAGYLGVQDPISLQPLGGNVGIGILSPSEKLEVAGNVKVAGIISGVSDPISAQDAATKAYVDAAISSPTYTIGLSAEQGGYIFWVSTDGKHGLVAETIDQSSSSDWYEAQDIISNPSNHSADGDNFRDWRMPTSYELNEMNWQESYIGGFSSGYYWSSTENGYEYALIQNFVNGGEQYFVTKDSNYGVRAVRSF